MNASLASQDQKLTKTFQGEMSGAEKILLYRATNFKGFKSSVENGSNLNMTCPESTEIERDPTRNRLFVAFDTIRLTRNPITREWKKRV